MNRVARKWPAWASSVCGGIVYALIVFVIGCVLGTIRVLFVIPRIGGTAAVLLEAPLMLLASWKISMWCIGRFTVGSEISARAVMGVCAFSVLAIAEIGVSAIFFGRSVSEHFAAYESLAGAIGLIAQLCFAAIPAYQLRQT